jgi:hypothetical protein
MTSSDPGALAGPETPVVQQPWLGLCLTGDGCSINICSLRATWAATIVSGRPDNRLGVVEVSEALFRADRFVVA